MKFIPQNTRITTFITFLFLLALFPDAWASPPGWNDVPKHLKNKGGVEQQDQWIFATGVAYINDIRPDKAHELARKKSMHHALQLLHVSLSCGELIKGLSENDIRTAYYTLSHIVSPISPQKISVIRQWEINNTSYTAVVVPKTSLSNIQCPFVNFSDAAAKLINQDDLSLEALALCLRQVPRHSIIARNIQKKMTENHRYKPNILYHLQPVNREVTLPQITFQMRLDLAEQETKKAKRLIKKKDFDSALNSLDFILTEVPSYTPALTLVSEYFSEANWPALALCAAENAQQGGTHFQETLNLKIKCLTALKSPEAKIYHFILSQAIKSSLSGYPAKFSPLLYSDIDLDFHYLILNSMGNAVMGQSQRPGMSHSLAIKLFNEATTDDDIQKTLTMLFKACQEKPYAAETYNLVGACYRLLDKPLHALPFLWAALAIQPGYDMALTNLGLCCQKLGVLKSAAFYFNHPAVQNSENAWIKDSYEQFIKH